MGTTNFVAFGNKGYEEEIDGHIKTRFIFGLADDQRQSLAWYQFGQGLRVALWQGAFDVASVGGRRLDRFEAFGGPGITGWPGLLDFAARLDRLAPPFGVGTPATLPTMTEEKTGLIDCTVSLHTSKGLALVAFDLRAEPGGERRSLDVDKGGHVFFFGVERFSRHAVDRGPTPATRPVDPRDPLW